MVAFLTRSVRRLALPPAVAVFALGGAAVVRADDHSPLRHYARQTWQTADGLPQNSVRAIVQTAEGYLWLATAEGLVRFDGVRFTVYDKRSTPALPTANVATLARAADGSLWIGLRRHGVARLHGGRLTTWTTAEGLSANELLSMTATADGSVWVGTAGHGLNRIRNGRITVYGREQGLPNNDCTALAPAPGGGVLVGTGAGAVVVSDAGVRPLVTTRDVPRGAIGALVEGHDRDIWVGTQDGLLRVAPSGITRLTRADGLPSDDIVSLTRGADGTIWIGTRSGGVARLRRGRIDAYTGGDGLPDELVEALYEDGESNLWVGTAVGGLTRLRDTPFLAVSKRDGLPADVIRAVYESRDGGMWVATNGYGLARLHGGVVTRWTSTTGLPSDAVSAIGESRDGAMWIGTRNGIVRLLNGTMTPFTTANGLPHDNVRSLFEDRDGVLWVGTMRGACRMAGAQCLPLAGVEAHVRAFHQSPDGALWIATHRGLFRHDHGRITRWGEREGLSSETITSIAADGDGTLWLSTSGGGLNRLRGGRIDTWRVAQGLHDDTIYRVLADDRGWLWMTSNRGLFRASREALEAVSRGRAASLVSHVYTEVDGLPSAEFNGGSFPAGVRAQDGRLWLPSVKGVVLVDPTRVAPAATAPPVFIERVTADGVHQPLTGAATIEPGDGKLEIQYTAFRFAAPSRLRFRFRLDGFDHAWVDAGARRTAYYTNLPPGSYTFRVGAADGAGDWGAADTTYAITMLPRFYQTRGFAFLVVASTFLLVVGGVHLRSARQRALERRLRAMVDARTQELQDEVAERKRAEAALVDAREAAIEASRLKSEFLANMSHEIRTPMNGVIGMTDLALGHALEPRVREYLQTVRSSADALLHVINDILDFAKIEAGKLDLAVVDFDLRQLVTDVVTLLGPRAREKGIDFQCVLPASLPPRLAGDPLRLRQVLTNLVGNALKFTDHGSVRVEIAASAAAPGEAPGGSARLRFAVIDTGIGIAAGDQSRIFDAFTQADGSSTRRFGGTGLGLAISAQLVHLMGGRLEVTSVLGQGSTFAFTLALAPAMATAAAAERARIVPSGRRLTVLVAEDNPVNQLLTQRLLEKAGHTATIVGTGTAALEALSHGTFDVVLMDVQMPEMNGFEATRSIRDAEGEHGRRLPIIALTAHAMRGDRERCLEAGMDGYVTKPIRADDLYTVLADVVHARDAA